MSCNDVASVLDTHRGARLAPAERAQLDAHLAACADCAAAWHAQTELLALRVPPAPAAMLERALLASRLPQSAPARRTRMPLIVASAVLAGAAAAAVTMSVLREQSGPTASSMPIEPPAAPATPAETLDAPATQADVSGPEPQGDGVTSVELVEATLTIAPLVRRPPDYPPEALKQGLAGTVQLEFDVTAAGFVENVSVVESSHPLFEEPAVRALSTWRYLPRIVAGKRVATTDQRTVIRWELQSESPPPVERRQMDAKAEANMRDFVAFSGDLEVALDRLAADDFRGVELQLDEMQALYGTQRADLWNFYGYLYTVQGRYDRAIDAYERSAAVYLASPSPGAGPWVPLAQLYYARHQYDVALKTLLRPQRALNGAGPPGGRRPSTEADALIERLRALGVTAESL
jgi:TonB family protein